MASADKNREVTYEIVEHIGVISQDNKGWARELNRVSWNGGPVKYDIRSWDPTHSKMGRGITMTGNEAKELRTLFQDIKLQ